VSTDRLAGSYAHFARAKRSLAGGVASNMRVSQRPVPLAVDHGRGPRLYDVDGNEYLDFGLAYGPMILGHSPEPVVAAMRKQLDRGLCFGACHQLEVEVAEAICRLVPSAELVSFGSSGSEAVHESIRIARSTTGRTRIIKFRGHYHGWFDSVHVGVPGRSDTGPGTSGQDPLAAASTTVLTWNDTAALDAAASTDVAAIIMEPSNVNGGAIAPHPGYLEHVREVATRIGAVLIFDEVITGFRLSLGGAQGMYGVTPDLTVLGKALGGGVTISAICGSAAVMDVVATGMLAHTGTFNVNPLVASGAAAAIRELEARADEIYPALELRMHELAELLESEAAAAGLPLRVNRTVGAGYAHVSSKPVESFDDTLASDADWYRQFAGELLVAGVNVVPRGLLYVSTEHTAEDIESVRPLVRQAAIAAVEKHTP
jgi:glutamate-1-semialdehyde 2,1-aminomutase